MLAFDLWFFRRRWRRLSLCRFFCFCPLFCRRRCRRNLSVPHVHMHLLWNASMTLCVCVCVLGGFVFAMRMWKSGSFCGAVLSLLAARKNILNGLRVGVARSLLRSDFRIIYLVVFCVCFLSTFARHARAHMWWRGVLCSYSENFAECSYRCCCGRQELLAKEPAQRTRTRAAGYAVACMWSVRTNPMNHGHLSARACVCAMAKI